LSLFSFFSFFSFLSFAIARDEGGARGTSASERWRIRYDASYFRFIRERCWTEWEE